MICRDCEFGTKSLIHDIVNEDDLIMIRCRFDEVYRFPEEDCKNLDRCYIENCSLDGAEYL